jgi:hypothetical protein
MAEVPMSLAATLVRAHAAELVAVGPARRAAWRTMRGLLGGAMAAGYSAHSIAQCLSVSSESVRIRAERDAWLSESAILAVSDLDRLTLHRWRTTGLLTEQRQAHDGLLSYPAAELVRALADAGQPLLHPRV